MGGLWPEMCRETYSRTVSSRRMMRRTRRSGHGGISAWSTPIPPRKLQRVRELTHGRLKSCSWIAEYGTARYTLQPMTTLFPESPQKGSHSEKDKGRMAFLRRPGGDTRETYMVHMEVGYQYTRAW